jgi:predicted  nucleic acid-binding Zn-ribbon protein
VSQDRNTPTSRPSERPEKETEQRRGDGSSSEEAKRLRREVDDLNRLLDRQAADVENLKRQEERLAGKCKRRDGWIAGLEQEIGRMRDSYQGLWKGISDGFKGWKSG